MAGVTIGRLADEVGVSVDTVRYYERRGLLPAPSRTRAGYRTYGDDDVHAAIRARVQSLIDRRAA